MLSSPTISLMQVALVIGISLAEVNRLVRQRQLPVHHTANKVKYVESAEILAYLRRTQP